MQTRDADGRFSAARIAGSDAASLRAALGALEPAPTASGTLTNIVRRCPDGRRETPATAMLVAGQGLDGDRHGEQWPPDPNRQVSVMRRDVAELLADGQPLTLFGDNLFIDLDLSPTNLPVGARISIGRAVIEVGPEPHLPCRKFRDRFGIHAARLAGSADGRAARLRGIMCRIVESGHIACGDELRVLTR